MLSRARGLFIRGWRSAGILVLTMLALAWFFNFTSTREPVSTWLVSDLARLWFWQFVLSSACVSAGYFTLEWLDEPGRPAAETLALAFPVGLVVFGVGFYIAGFLRLFHWQFAVAWPLVLIAFGGPLVWRAWRPRAPCLPAEGDTPRELAAPASGVILHHALWLAGGAGVLLVYLGMLSPDAVNYDAAWMHLVIAQDYAREGRVVPFRGDWVKSVPHLGSVIHTWDFLVPGFGPTRPLRWMMALHTEFSVFIWTLVGIAAGVNWVLRRKVAGAWAAMFLFPAILAHDSNIGGAADHIVALFAVPLVMLGATATNQFRWKSCVLWGLVAGGALLVKLQATYVIGPLGLWFVARLAVNLWRARNLGQERMRHVARVLGGAALLPAVALLVFGVHGARNWWFHNNPMYPLMQDVFVHSRPRVRDADLHIRFLFKDWRAHPAAALGERAWTAVKLLWSFSFVPHYSFQKELPITGSLFTLTAPLVLLLKGNRRLLLMFGLGFGAIFWWAMTYLVDRNLQVFLPLLVVATAGTVAAVWQAGVAAKLGISLLVAFQLACAGEVWFSGGDRIISAITLIRSRFDGRAERRYADYRRPYVELGDSLPPRAVVLLHNQHGSLGIDRRVVLDWSGFQGQIDYRTMHTVADLWRRLVQLKITHVVYWPGLHPASSKQEEILFAVFSRVFAPQTQGFGVLQVFPMPAEPPSSHPYEVGVIGVPGLQNGVYDIEELGQNESYPPQLLSQPNVKKASSDINEVLAHCQVALVGNDVSTEVNEKLGKAFRPLGYNPGYRIFWRTTD